MKIVLPGLARPLIEPGLPAGLDVHWFMTLDDARVAVVDADIAWIDVQGERDGPAVAELGQRLKWLFTMRAGVDAYDKVLLASRGTVLTNGTGLNPNAVAEYAVMGMLVAAKRYDQVLRMADRQEWPTMAPGQMELEGSSALIIGYGTIGRLIARRLSGFDMTVTGVTRSGADGTLTPDQWRARLGEYDWVIVATPATADTRAMIGADELAAMKQGAWLINVGRGDMVDQPALIEALAKKRIAGAFLDVVTPEPLPPGDPLWTAPNAIHSMHMSGRSQTTMFTRAAALFLRNLEAFLAGRPMENVVDLAAGY